MRIFGLSNAYRDSIYGWYISIFYFHMQFKFLYLIYKYFTLKCICNDCISNNLIIAHEFDARRRMISKTFYQQLRSSERQSLVGPPESMREHVVAAAKAMRNGNWSACNNFIINEKMNAKV